MSWTVFHTECMALTGMKHVSRIQYSQTMANAYHASVLRHFDTLTAGGTVINTSPKLAPLIQGFLQVCEQNMTHHKDVNWVQQIGPFIQQYWSGAIIIGPTGIVNVTSVGQWNAPSVKQNMDFNIILYSLEAACRVHITTLQGIYTSTVVPNLVTPWAGGFLVTIP